MLCSSRLRLRPPGVINYLHNCVIRARTLKVSFLIWEKITPDRDLCVWKHSQELVCGLRPSKKIFNFKLDIGTRARGCSKYAWWIDLLFLFQNTIASCSTFEEVEIKYKKISSKNTENLHPRSLALLSPPQIICQATPALSRPSPPSLSPTLLWRKRKLQFGSSQ